MSSMFPGFVESVKDGWNKITGGKNEVDIEETEDEPTSAPESAAPSIPLLPIPPAETLTAGLALVGAEGLLHATERAKKSLQEYEVERKKLETLSDLLAQIRDNTKEDGGVEIKDAKFKKLLKDASEFVPTLPQNKTKLTKDERDNIKQTVDAKIQDVQYQIQLYTHKITKSQQDHTSLLVELKKLWDQYNEIIRTFNRNIPGR